LSWTDCAMAAAAGLALIMAIVQIILVLNS